MFGAARAHRSASSSANPSFLRGTLRNLFRRAGFVTQTPEHSSPRIRNMSSAAHGRRLLPQLPRDYIRRRRFFRRVTNATIIVLLSLAAAYLITRQSGGPGFSLPKSAVKTALSLPPSSSPTALTIPGDAASTPAFPAAISAEGYKLAPGPHHVAEVSDIVLHDAKRNKDLHLRVFYPAEAGNYPVIVFSHGAGGSQTCCDELTRHWASYGYITLQPTHEDSTVQRRNSGEQNIQFLQAVREALKKPALWESRPLDISFVLDSLPLLQKRIPALETRMDTARIGVGGHSMGAFTADAIAGALVDLPGKPAVNFSDPRVKSVLLLSPQGPGEFGLTEHSWDRISLPVMSMTGSLDSGAAHQGPGWKKIPFDRSQPGDKYHLFIDGANHMSFITAQTLLPARAAQAEAILGYTNSASLAFWDAYLKNDAPAKQYLQSDALPNSSHNAVKLSRR
jgi:predicted dienelactone hydrolase